MIRATGPNWSHTHPIGAATTDADVLKATGAVASDADVLKTTGVINNVSVTLTGNAGTCGAVGCTAIHPASVVAQRTNVLEGSGASKVAAVTATGAAKVAAVTAIPTTTGAPVQ